MDLPTFIPWRSEAAAACLRIGRRPRQRARSRSATPSGGLPRSPPAANVATRGDTNREIARRPYITVSTVEQHLTRVYRKLNVAGREDLAVRLHAATTVAQSV